MNLTLDSEGLPVAQAGGQKKKQDDNSGDGSRIFGVGKYFHSKSTRPFLITKKRHLSLPSAML
ncbi:hypothetical protein ATX87_01785 [Oenococcus oeni]|nr:hypothetical protein ATW61_10215 [Oenococcus oeni]OIK57691.1 hypothetical protein ATW61_01780 [Oenococcus oeni]OIM61416.1 hypothetical protein ATX87_10420 [Oenococcus oeni]OIM64492.1 hypothetical protein ATX87_01785 [Oenococcus oeni]